MDSSDRSDSIGLTPEHTVSPRKPAPGWEREYEKTRNLGSGGYAEVFEARHRTSGETVAIKVPHAHPDAAERFRKEVSEQSKCQHPHVMPILASGVNWYAMPLAQGTLRTLAPSLSDEDRLLVVDHVARGLAHAHEVGVVHRDVTPSNILRVEDASGQRWVVGDFGLVRRPRGQTTGPHTRGPLGTPGFEAPEMAVLGAHGVDQRADIYSLGMTIAFMVTGAWPDELSGVEIPPAWAALVARMTAVALDERHQNIEEVRATLDDVRAAIGRQRAARWKLPSGASTLKPYEVAVLAAMLDEGDGGIRQDDLRRCLRPREVSLGLIALRARAFIKNSTDGHGEPWGVQLTPEGIGWVLANDHLILAVAPGAEEAPRAPAAGPDDDIPF